MNTSRQTTLRQRAGVGILRRLGPHGRLRYYRFRKSVKNLLNRLVGGPVWRVITSQLSRRPGILEQFPPRPLNLPGHYHETAPPLPESPKISIVTPSYNQGRFLERTLESVLGQNYEPLEFIVQDGGSTDESPKILERFSSRLHHAESIKDRGQAHAINLGFSRSTGSIMAYLNSDDVLLPGALHYVARFFAEHPQVDVVYGHRIVINDRDEEVGRWILPPYSPEVVIWNDYVPQETLFWRRGIWDQVGGKIDEAYHSALDWDLLLRFFRAGACFQRLPRFLGAFRIHPEQKTETLAKDRGIPEQNRLRTWMHGRPVSRLESRNRVASFLMKSYLCQCLFQLGILRY